eukprot:scaffold1251_cov333-Pavlova_lutheri.AAC.14
MEGKRAVQGPIATPQAYRRSDRTPSPKLGAACVVTRAQLQGIVRCVLQGRRPSGLAARVHSRP